MKTGIDRLERDPDAPAARDRDERRDITPAWWDTSLRFGVLGDEPTRGDCD